MGTQHKLFGSLILFQTLIKLGFITNDHQKGSHVKLYPPKKITVPLGVKPFMIVQMGKKQFDKHECSRYISELVQKGIDRKEIIRLMNECE